MWLQHAVVLLAVAACAAFAGWEAFRTFAGRRGRVGSCCDKGCGGGADAADKPTPERVVFLPAADLRVTRRPRDRAPHSS